MVAETSYERYFVREPLYEEGLDVINRQSPTMTYMSAAQVPEADYYIEFGWVYDGQRVVLGLLIK